MGSTADYLKSRIVYLTICAFIALCAVPMAANALPAFPGAQGWGSTTVGGRGGKVIFVTNTSDSGTGSLRAAVTASGPRIVVFKVGGTIVLGSTLRINNPYITIAGQTAPGGGIQLRGGQVQVTTHDVIMRGLRIRSAAQHSIELNADMGGGNVYNCIFDHNSFAYGMDENVTSWTNNQATWDQTIEDITFSWNIVGPPLWNCSGCEANHASGYLNNPWVGRTTFHHNYFTNNQIRNPIVEGPSYMEWINNYFYNWAHESARLYWGAIFVKNHWQGGPNTTADYAVRLNTTGNPQGGNMQPDTVYLSHNLGPGRTTDSGDDWALVSGGSNETYRTDTPPWPLSGVGEHDVAGVKSIVLQGAGASAPSRDSLDTEMVDDALNGTGSYISSPYWPTLAAGTAPADTDNDGMPDSWESAHGLNPNNAADGNSDRDGDGYTNIEEYFNSLIPTVATSTPPTPPPPSPPPPSTPPPPGTLTPNAPTNLQIQ